MILNNFEIKVIGGAKPVTAAEEANKFIQKCNDEGKRILSVEHEFFHKGSHALCSFIFKVEIENEDFLGA